MYALLSIVLFLVGAALIAVVLVRKMPALAALPEKEAQNEGGSILRPIRSLLARINWRKWQRLVVVILAFFLEGMRRVFTGVARRSERLLRSLRSRIRHLSDDVAEGKKPFPFSSRIRRRSAFLEEERRLIEQLTSNPRDILAYRRLGNLYTIAGNAADARAAFSEVLRLSPEDTEAKRRLEELGENGRK